MDADILLRAKLAKVWPSLDERARRLMAAKEAIDWGYGGVAAVHRACGLSRTTIARGIAEIEAGASLESDRIRRSGGGRKSLRPTNPRRLAALDALIASGPSGEPASPLHWVSKTTRALAAQLRRQGRPISHVTVAQLLHDKHFHLEGIRKTQRKGDDFKRDAQFGHINTVVKAALAVGGPVISVDTKRDVMPAVNGGRQWRTTKQAVTVLRTFPYGLYDIGGNAGFVNVRTDHDAGAFAVASIRGWWRAEGRRLYPQAQELIITVDTVGWDRDRLRLWTLELQKLADATGLDVAVCHFPPGTRKWNDVEHRLFSFISSNWRGWPRRDDETIVNLIARTTRAKGLTVTCRLDRRQYPLLHNGPGPDMEAIGLKRDQFHGNWNYRIRPTSIDLT